MRSKIFVCSTGLLLVFILTGTVTAGVIEQDAEDSYSCDGKFIIPCSNAVDENWNSYAYCDQQFCGIYENYFIPAGTNSAEWTTKIGVMRADPFSTKVICYNYDSLSWAIILDISGAGPAGYKDYIQTINVPSGCLKGDQLKIWTEVLDFAAGDSRYFEGKVTWNITVNVPEYPSIAMQITAIISLFFVVFFIQKKKSKF